MQNGRKLCNIYLMRGMKLNKALKIEYKEKQDFTS